VGRDLTLIVMIDRRVGLSLSCGERAWGQFVSVAMKIRDAESEVSLVDLEGKRLLAVRFEKSLNSFQGLFALGFGYLWYMLIFVHFDKHTQNFHQRSNLI